MFDPKENSEDQDAPCNMRFNLGVSLWAKALFTVCSIFFSSKVRK